MQGIPFSINFFLPVSRVFQVQSCVIWMVTFALYLAAIATVQSSDCGCGDNPLTERFPFSDHVRFLRLSAGDFAFLNLWNRTFSPHQKARRWCATRCNICAAEIKKRDELHEQHFKDECLCVCVIIFGFPFVCLKNSDDRFRLTILHIENG